MSEKAHQGRPLAYGRQDGPCAVCGEIGRACGRCGIDFYCGKEHQTKDWPRHKQGCGCVAVREDPVLGRHLVAAKDIPAGTVFMRELPLVVFPKPVGAVTQAICVGCGRLLAGTPRSAQCCLRCGWPVCGEPCSQRPEHQAECAAFQRAGYKLRDVEDLVCWDALATLRVYLAMKEGPEGWRLEAMQSTLPQPGPDTEGLPSVRWWILRGHELYGLRVQRLVEWLTVEAGLTWLDPEELRRADGVLFVNSNTADHRGWLGCLFAGASRLEHSCAPNTDCSAWAAWRGGAEGEGGHVDHDDMEHVLVAGSDLKRGQHLTLSYKADPFDSKSFRRKTLACRWGFYCRCSLCEDPTQCGLFLDSWYCGLCKSRGEQHLVLVDDGWTWRCQGCRRSGDTEDPTSDPACAQALALEERLRALKDADEAGDEVPGSEWEALIRDALWPRGPMHPASSVVLQARLEASQIMSTRLPVEAMAEACVSGGPARAAAHLRALLAALDALRCGSHAASRVALRSRLFVHIVMSLGVEVATRAVMDLSAMDANLDLNALVAASLDLSVLGANHLDALLGARAGLGAENPAQQKQRVKALQQEAEKLLQVMQKTAVVPADREAVKKHGEDFQEVCKKLGLPCT